MEDEHTYFVLIPRKRRRGYRYNEQMFNQKFIIVKAKTTPTEKWHRDLNRAIKKLETSGLWPNQKEIFKNLMAMTYEEHQDIISHRRDMDYLRTTYLAKFPFLFTGSDGNLDYIYIDVLSDCRLKSMYFGKSQNKLTKARIAEALRTHTAYNTGRIPVSYDVSFEYNPEKQAAWYSEEYRYCGNGHYYLALDENTAVFCEDD